MCMCKVCKVCRRARRAECDALCLIGLLFCFIEQNLNLAGTEHSIRPQMNSHNASMDTAGPTQLRIQDGHRLAYLVGTSIARA